MSRISRLSRWTRQIRSIAPAALALAGLAASAHAEPPRQGLRVAAWNITFYDGDLGPQIQTAVYGEFEGRSFDPDVILLQEITSQSALNALVGHLNAAPTSPGDWAAGTYYPASSIECAVVYRTSRVDLVQSQRLWAGGPNPNHPRAITRHDFQPEGYGATTIAVYPSHMKAGSGTTDRQRKLVEAERIRADSASLPADWHFIFGGDTNIRTSEWAAYRQLVEFVPPLNESGRFFDPIATPGNWNNNSAFRFVHTQDPSSNAGMDDRFDQLLLSHSLVDGEGIDYIGNPAQPFSTFTWDDPAHSHRSWGNDGTSFNNQLRTVGNTMVGPAIAQALIDLGSGAGHIPVYLDLQLPAVAQIDTQLLHFGTRQVGETASLDLTIAHGGDLAAWGAGGLDDLEFALTPAAPFMSDGLPGVVAPDGAPVARGVGLDTSTAGVFSDTLEVATNDPAQPTISITTVGRVVECIADWDASSAVNIFDILAYLDAFTLGDLGADLNGDQALSIFDILAYLDRFEDGCG